MKLLWNICAEKHYQKNHYVAYSYSSVCYYTNRESLNKVKIFFAAGKNANFHSFCTKTFLILTSVWL